MTKLYYAVLAVLASIMMPACREANPETPEPGIGLQMYSWSPDSRRFAFVSFIKR
ncbi:MAG: hypothetical protein MJY79_05480 [Bacteroidaceae bacterium]|nr:hypothetical protein [Bacteroidaceae bacterium]